jgi:hypothetical protein
MNGKLGLGVAVAASLVVAAVAPAASARPAVTHQVRPAITQSYTCSTPIGDISLSGTVTGKASIKSGTISLKKVVYAINNSVGFDLVVDHVKISTPDPSKSSAPYKKGSATTAKKPKGWKAGHDKVGIFASHAKSMTILNGQDVTSAALSAKYTVKGEPGTVIEFHPGDVTFHVTSPVEGDVTCMPDDPVGTFASVTE